MTRNGDSRTGAEPRAGGRFDGLKTVLWAIVIALVVRMVVMQPFYIPSGSMIPSLLVGDFLFVSKYSYGYSRYSFDLFGIELLPFSFNEEDGRVLGSLPERGEIAVFKWPGDNETDFIKRIVGLPGDVLEIRAGVLHVNGEAAAIEPDGMFENRSRTGRRIRAEQFIENLPEDVRHLIIRRPGSAGQGSIEPFTVPDDSYFMMGDNRDGSRDSREWGFVPAENLVGRAEFLLFSVDYGEANWYEVWDWIGHIRYGRIFDPVE